MSTIRVKIAGASVAIREKTLIPHFTLDQRKTASFTVVDDTGLLSVQPGQPVTITDSVAGLLFSGYVNDARMTNLAPSTTNFIAVQCMDNKWLADKDYAKKDYVGWFAGDAACDLVANYLAQKGVKAAYALRRDTTANQFNQGTLSSVVGANNISDGDLELALAGSSVTFQQQSQADFNAGTTGGGLSSPTGGGVTFTATQAIKFTSSMTVPGSGNDYIYVKIWTGNYTIVSGDSLVYDVWIADSSPAQMSAVDFVCTDGSTLRDSLVGGDAQGILPHPNNDLTGLATNTWYNRKFNLNPIAGKIIAYMTIAYEGNNTGNYTSYFRNILINNGSTTQATIFGSTATATQATPQQIATNGYTSPSVSVVTAYERHGTMSSPAFSLANAGIVRSSFLTWSITLPTSDFTFTVTATLDGSATSLPCTLNAPIPGLIAGMKLTGVSVLLVYTFDNVGNDPTLTPVLSNVTGSVQPAYAATKSDIISTTHTQAGWQAGTLTNLVAPGGATLQLNGFARNYDNGDFSNQTIFSVGSSLQGVLNRTCFLQVQAATDIRSQLVFAGQWQNFTTEVDITVATVGDQYGYVYRTTGWQNNPNTFAYSVIVTTTQIVLGRGTNSSSGTGTFTSISTVPITLSSGNSHRLKLVVNGNSHQAFIDNVLLINATDTTYPNAGYLGLRYLNNGATTNTAQFDNFGVVANLSGTWVSPPIDIHALGTIGNSQIITQVDGANSSLASTLTEISLNNGATYTACTNGAVVPGLAPGTNVSAMTQVLIRITISSTTASTGAAMPDITGVTLFVLGAYSSSGTRISPVLSLAGVAGAAGSTLVSWNGVQFTNTTIGIDTSLDGTTWTVAGSGASGSAAIAGVAVQPAPTDDAFSTNTSSSYTSTARTGGVNATWVWDTTNNRVTVSGGTNALLLYTSITTSDIDLIVDLDESDASGMVWRVQDISNYYELVAFDGSSSAGSTNVLKLYKVVANVRSQIGSNLAVTFKRGTPYRVRVTMIGTTITVYFDGTSVLSTTDSSLAGPGQCGMSSQTGIARFYQIRIQPLTASVAAQNVYSRVRLTSTDPTATPQLSDITLSVHGISIQNGALIPVAPYSVLSGSQNTIAQDLDDLAKQSNNLIWDIDQNSSLTFQGRNAVPAPWIASAVDISTSNILYSGVSVETIADLYRNTQFLTGGTDTISFSETRMGDSVSRSWSMGYAVDSVTSITVDGVTKTVGVKGVDTGKDFYYTQGNNSVVEDASGPLYDDTRTIIFTYNAIVSITVEMRNDTQIAARAAVDGTDGIVALVEDVSNLGLPKSGIIQLGQGRLDQYAIIARTIGFSTMRSGLAVGLLLPIFLPQFSVINSQSLITDIGIRWFTTVIGGVEAQQPFYDVIATEGPIVGDYTRFLADLAKGK